MAKSVFDHVNHICEFQTIDYFDTLEEVDRKTFSTFMVHRVLSMTKDYIPLVNEVQQYPLKEREVYLVYSQLLPRKRTFSKYVKAIKKEETHPEWLIALVAQEHMVSTHEATVYIDILYRTDDGKQELRDLCTSWAIDAKQLKKVSL